MSSFVRHQNGDCVDDIPVKEYDVSVFPQNPSNCYEAGEEDFGEPDILPRIGDEYQVELPPLIREPNHMPYAEVEDHSPQDFFVGLPIPLIWIDFGKNGGPEMVIDSRNPNNKKKTERVASCNGDVKPSYDSVMSKGKIRSLRRCISEGHLLVPGSVTESWSDAEKASFLLALYIFEKNFVEVRRFVGIKNMGAILSFYYGEFYGSGAYHRWSEGRKTRSKKCVYGQRIFSGLRQQEFLSRLLPRVSEECKSTLVEVSKAFSDDKMSLVEYTSSLKATAGMSLIVEAVAIGSGKQDLTGMALEPLRSNHVARSEIPAGKACSALSTTEIIKFLSGDYRLSKARSNDIFWEAVWPRLLARGWHSEQPHNQGYVAGSKCLVFLLPGIKKFSRRKLVKGDHYFDSVTDVLSKVAKDPGLIELDIEEVNGKQVTEKAEWNNDVKMDEDKNDPPSRQRHSYLQPRTPNRSADAIKFTVVDTGLLDGKIRELRTLPREISSTMISLDALEEEDVGGNDRMNSNRVDLSAAATQTCKSGPKKVVSRKNRDDNTSSQGTHAGHIDVGRSSPSLKKKKDANDNHKPRKVSKSLPQKQKQSFADNIAPISKRCKRLILSTSEEEARDGVILSLHSTSAAPRLENGVSGCSSRIHESNETTQVSMLQDKLSSASSSRGSPSESTDFPQTSTHLASEPTQENPPQPQLLIDLNLPHVAPEMENNELAPDLPNEVDNQSVQPDNHGSAIAAAAPTPVETSSEQQSNANMRRLSTRNRPPTTRALEAVAGGYLSVSRRRKGRDTSSTDAQLPRPSQLPRVGPGPSDSPSSSVASLSQIGESSSQIAETERGASVVSLSQIGESSSQIAETERGANVVSYSQIGESSSQIAETDQGASTSGTSNADNKNDDPPEANQEEPAPRQ